MLLQNMQVHFNFHEYLVIFKEQSLIVIKTFINVRIVIITKSVYINKYYPIVCVCAVLCCAVLYCSCTINVVVLYCIEIKYIYSNFNKKKQISKKNKKVYIIILCS